MGRAHCRRKAQQARRSSASIELLGEIEYEWRYIAAAIRNHTAWLLKGRDQINKAACAPREHVNGVCAVSWGVEPNLARRMLEW